MSELEKTVAEILVKATSAAEAAGKFAVEQLPDIAQQYVTYIAILNGFWLVFGLVLLVGTPMFVRWLCKDGDGFGSPSPSQGFVIGLFCAAFPSFLILAINLKDFILAVFAPKILLIQWAATLVK